MDIHTCCTVPEAEIARKSFFYMDDVSLELIEEPPIELSGASLFRRIEGMSGRFEAPSDRALYLSVSHQEHRKWSVSRGDLRLILDDRDASTQLFDERVDPLDLDDLSLRRPEAREALLEEIGRYRRTTPRAPARVERVMSDEELEQLRRMGYLEREADADQD